VAASGYNNAAFPTPLSVTILALAADGLKSLRSAGISKEYLASQTRVFTDLLRCLGARWGLASKVIPDLLQRIHY
jgi:hypothetical protein